MDEKAWLESILKKKAYEEQPLKIVDFETSAGVGKNENYLSSLVKMKANVLLGSGKQKRISVMVKNLLGGPFMRMFTNKLGVFVREITMYRDVLPKMEDLLEETGETEGSMWPKCYDVRLYDRLVLEDLSISGFRMEKRTEQLSLDASLLVARSLAKFHALSHVLLKRCEIPMDLFRENIWKKEVDMYHHQNMKCFKMLLKSIDSWGDEWRGIRDRFEKAMTTMTHRAMDLTVPAPDDFVVLNHGDCWTNNFLFRYDSESNRPIAMKFVDFQLPFVGSPSYDLIYLLASSVTPENYTSHSDQILRTYCDQLRSTLVKLGVDGQEVPDFDKMKQLMRKAHLLYLFNAIFLTPVILGESKDIPDLEEAFRLEMEAKQRGEETANAWNVHANLGEPAKKVIQFALKDAINNELI